MGGFDRVLGAPDIESVVPCNSSFIGISELANVSTDMTFVLVANGTNDFCSNILIGLNTGHKMEIATTAEWLCANRRTLILDKTNFINLHSIGQLVLLIV